MSQQNEHDLQKEIKATGKRLKNTKYLLIPVLVLWPFGFFINPLSAFFIFLFSAALFCVCTYIAFMHNLSAKKKLERLKAHKNEKAAP